MDEVIKLSLKIVESLVSKIVPSSINGIEIRSVVMPYEIYDSRIIIRIEDSRVNSNLGVATIITPPNATLFITEDDRKEYKRQFEKMARSEIEDVLVTFITLINTQNKEPEFTPVKIGERYFYIAPLNYLRQGFYCGTKFNVDEEIDKEFFYANNYFKTEERAEEVLNKFKTLLLLERFYDTYCPNYKPNWGNRHEYKFRIYYDNSDEKWRYDCVSTAQTILTIYFPNEKIAQKVCDRLNKEDIKP